MTIDKASAQRLFDAKFWEPMTHRERAEFQLWQPLLCMPFPVFHEAVEQALGRPVYTHEFGRNLDGLRAEFLGERTAPSLKEIIDLIPEEKRLLCVVPGVTGATVDTL